MANDQHFGAKDDPESKRDFLINQNRLYVVRHIMQIAMVNLFLSYLIGAHVIIGINGHAIWVSIITGIAKPGPVSPF